MRAVGLRLTGSRRLVTVQTGMRRAPLLLLAGVTLLAGCTKSAQATHGRHPWSRAGVLRVAIGEEPKNLNPLLAGTVPEIFVDRLMFEPLISADAHGNPVPILAQTVPTQANGGISRDGLTITYRLRHDVRWSDGVALTARDVRWSWQAIENPNNDVGFAARIRRRGVDRHTRRLHGRRAPQAPLRSLRQYILRRERSAVRNSAGARFGEIYINHIPFDAPPLKVLHKLYHHPGSLNVIIKKVQSRIKCYMEENIAHG